jgi:soluble lytic murein transglycosylase-like protein
MSFSTTVARVDELLAQIDPPAGTAPSATTAAAADATAATTGAGASSTAFADQLARSTASASLPAEAQRFQPMVARAARYWGVDPDVINAVIEHESRFQPGATNPASGAAGLMQLMPATAKGLGVANPYDPAQNIWGGAHLLSTQLQHFHGDLRLALAAYSAGAGAVEHYGGVPPYAETTQFVNWMMNRVAQLKGEST